MSIKHLLEILNSDLRYRHNCVNLNASENYTSTLVKSILNQPAYDNYTFPPAGGEIQGPWAFSPKTYYDQITDHITKLCHELLNTSYVDPRPKGGQGAEIAVLLALAESGDTVFYVQEKDGGHFGLNFSAKKCGINLVSLEFDSCTQLLEIQKNVEKMQQYWQPNNRKLVIIGQSYILRKQPYQAFSQAVKQAFPDVILSCDTSHTLGLLIGKQFPNPLHFGFDILHASTHKTFPGPQKAIIALPEASLNLRGKLDVAVSPGLLSNCGTTEIYALAIAFEEMKEYAADYAYAVCNNAKHFAKQLDKCGFKVIGEQFDYTETHQVWIQTGSEETAWHAASILHRANIRTFPTQFPFVDGLSGLRIGTNALTRRGLTPEDFAQIATIMKNILLEGAKPEIMNTEVDGIMYKYPFGSLAYSFDNHKPLASHFPETVPLTHN